VRAGDRVRERLARELDAVARYYEEA
jgi:hypothetical protein